MTPEYKALVNGIHTVLADQYTVVENPDTRIVGVADRTIHLARFILDTDGWVYNFSPTSTRYIPLSTLEDVQYQLTNPDKSWHLMGPESRTQQVRPFPTSVPIYTLSTPTGSASFVADTKLYCQMYWQFFLESPIRMPDGHYLYAYCWVPGQF
jgi:hypothetical protein